MFCFYVHLKQTFPPIFFIFTEGEGDEIESRLPFKLFFTLKKKSFSALVNKIMRGQFAPIRGQYSPMFKQLVRDLLQKDPEFRPSATTILLERMPELLAQFENR